MPYFRKKPVVIEARPFTELTAREIEQWCVEAGTDAFLVLVYGMDQPHLRIRSPGGMLTADLGDWVIRDGGAFSPMKPDLFAATYDEVVEAPAEAGA